MRLDLCRRLKKVVTPFEGNLRTAGSNLLKPVGLCTARIIIQGLLYSVQFVVLSSCTHEIILGWDFLSITHAIIFCGNSQLSLQELPDDDQHVSALVNKVRASEDTIITPRSSSFVLINCCSLSPGDYFITPTSALLEKKRFARPTWHRTYWPSVDVHHHNQRYTRVHTNTGAHSSRHRNIGD